MAFEVGDLVQLKSGSPKMTVTDLPESNAYHQYVTVWFAGARRETGRFPEEALIPAQEDEKK
jgi:uncharacterized protein YodC (DUF2158 family)